MVLLSMCYYFLYGTILTKFVLFLYLVLKQNHENKLVENDVESGEEVEALQKQPVQKEFGLEKKGWTNGLFCSKFFNIASSHDDDRCSLHEETGFCDCYVQIPQN